MTKEQLEAYAQEMRQRNMENIKTIEKLQAEIKALRNEQTDDRMCPFMNDICVRGACAVYRRVSRELSPEP